MNKFFLCFATVLLFIASSASAKDSFERISFDEVRNNSKLIDLIKYGATSMIQKAANNNDIDRFFFRAVLHDAWGRTAKATKYYKFNTTLYNDDGVTIRTWFTVRLYGKDEVKSLAQWKYFINVDPSSPEEEPTEEPTEENNVYVPLEPSEYDNELVQDILTESVKDIIANNPKIPRATYQLYKVNSIDRKRLDNGDVNYKYNAEFRKVDESAELKVRFVAQYESDSGDNRVLSYKWNYNSL